jgi:hypothetical protein
MISLRVSATKLVNKNEPEEIPKEFPSRLEPSNELYTVLPVVFLIQLITTPTMPIFF